MSKANILPTPIRSRRAVLAGLASAAALPLAAAVPAIAETTADPIFAMVNEFRRADADLAAAFEPLQEENVVDKLWVRQEAAYERVIRTRPTTPAGLAALTTWGRERMDWLRKHGSSFEGDKLYELSAAIDNAARGMSGLKPWSPADGQSNTQADPVIALAERTIAAWNDFEAKCSVTSEVEGTVIDWRNLNPQPEQETALKEWGAKKRLVERESGYTRAEAAQQRASGRFGDLRDELVYARPISVAGLRAKAHAARTSSDEDLQQQIVFDIGVLFGDLDSNEEPIAAGLGNGGQS